MFSKYKIELKSIDKISYSILPKPHYVVKNLSILNNDNEIGKVQNLKVFISLNNFFLLKNLEIRDIVLNKTDFSFDQLIESYDEIYSSNEFEKGKISIKKSSINEKSIVQSLDLLVNFFDN